VTQLADLAGIWRDKVVSPFIGVVQWAQACGEAPDGVPRLYAFSLTRSLFTAMLFREAFGEASDDLPDLARLAEHGRRVALRGLAAPPE
jgi:hypothetical protein